MNRWLVRLAVVIAVVVIFGACQKTKGPGAAFKDGVYFATYGHVGAQGWKPQLEIVIAKGRIDKIDYDYVTAAGQRKTADEAYGKAMEAAHDRPTGSFL